MSKYICSNCGSVFNEPKTKYPIFSTIFVVFFGYHFVELFSEYYDSRQSYTIPDTTPVPTSLSIMFIFLIISIICFFIFKKKRCTSCKSDAFLETSSPRGKDIYDKYHNKA